MKYMPRTARPVLARLLTVVVLAVVWAPLASPAPAAHAAPQALTLTPSLPTGVEAGTPITWTATTTDPNPVAYQFSVGTQSKPATVVRDYSLQPSFQWAPPQEGPYTIMVTAKEISTTAILSPTYDYGNGATTQASMAYTVTTSVTKTAIISATANPLVALYRAPSCSAGYIIAAQFRVLNTTPWTLTTWQPCVPPLTRPFYVAGMLPTTTYEMRHVIAIASSQAVVAASAIQTFKTGTLPSSLNFPAVAVTQPPTAQSDSTSGVIDFEFSSGPSPIARLL